MQNTMNKVKLHWEADEKQKKKREKNETVENDDYGLLSEYHVGCFPGNPIQGNVPQSPQISKRTLLLTAVFQASYFQQSLRDPGEKFFGEMTKIKVYKWPTKLVKQYIWPNAKELHDNPHNADKRTNSLELFFSFWMPF